MVDNHYTGKVDSVPDFVDIFLKELTLIQAKPYIMKNTAVVCHAAGGAKPPKSTCPYTMCKVRD